MEQCFQMLFTSLTSSTFLCSHPRASAGRLVPGPPWIPQSQVPKFLSKIFVSVYVEPTDMAGQLYLTFTPYNSVSQGLKVSLIDYIFIIY